MASRASPALRAWSEPQAPQGERQRLFRVLRQPARDRRPGVRTGAALRAADAIRLEQCREHCTWQMVEVRGARPVGESHQQMPVLRAEEGEGRRALRGIVRNRIAVARRRNVDSIGSSGLLVWRVRALFARHFLRASPSISGCWAPTTVLTVLPALAVRGRGSPHLILGSRAR